MPLNEKYSYQDFMGQDFTDRPASEFNNSEIVGSCFYHEGETNEPIFPDGITGVTFSKCNLDNIFVPNTCTVEPDCSHRKTLVQNDLEDWIVDGADKPLEPLHKKRFEKLGLSIYPNDIPVTKKTKPITVEKSLALKQADIDKMRAYDPELAEKVGL